MCKRYTTRAMWTEQGELESLKDLRVHAEMFHAANQHLQSMPGGHSSSKILMNRNLQPVDSSTAYLSVVYSMSTIFLGAFTSVIIRLFSILSQREWRREQSSGGCSLLYRMALRSANQTEASQIEWLFWLSIMAASTCVKGFILRSACFVGLAEV